MYRLGLPFYGSPHCPFSPAFLVTPYPWSHLGLLLSSRVLVLASYNPSHPHGLPTPPCWAGIVFCGSLLHAFLSLSAGLVLIIVDIRVARWRISPHHLHGGGAKSWVTLAHIPWWRGGEKMVVVVTMSEVANGDGGSDNNGGRWW